MLKDNQILERGTTDKNGVGRAFGTFGELLQGVLVEDDSDFLVTFPIQLYTRATYFCRPESDKIIVTPAYKQKAKELANLIIKYFALPEGGLLEISSDIPVGKGLASSSADLVATSRAIESCFNVQLPIWKLEEFMARVEPSDGVMYLEVVSFFHRKVKLFDKLGLLEGLVIIGIDEGGEIDTVEYNKIEKSYTLSDRKMYGILLDEISSAVRSRDVKTIGKIATQSAIMNQRINPKRNLDTLLDICQEVDALGVITSHSGTCIGLLLDKQDHKYKQKYHSVYKKLHNISGQVLTYDSWEGEKTEYAAEKYY